MKTELEIDNWKRKSHYHFFKNYDNPFYNICGNIEITELYDVCKADNFSFFLGYLYLSVKTANKIEEFRYRIEDDKVFIYDRIHPFSTILCKDGTFKFCDFKYSDNFCNFYENAQLAIKKTLDNDELIAGEERNDVIHYTSIPWISLTGMTHAKNFNSKNSVPKIVFGKTFKEDSRLMMPICVEVHHSLVDGIHVGKYFNLFRELIAESENLLKS